MSDIMNGELHRAECRLDEIRAIAARHGSTMDLAMAELRAARIGLVRGDPAAAREAAEAAREIYDSIDSLWGGVANATGTLAEAALLQGDHQRAIELAFDAVDGLIDAGAERYAVFRFATVAVALTAAGRHKESARISGMIDAWLDVRAFPLFPVAVADFEQAAAQSCALLGERATPRPAPWGEATSEAIAPTWPLFAGSWWDFAESDPESIRLCIGHRYPLWVGTWYDCCGSDTRGGRP